MKKLRLFDSLKFVVAAIVCTFILNVAHAAILPVGYTELEYLQTDGNAYIDTGILLSNTDTFEITFQSALGTLASPVMGAISGGTSYTSTNNLSVTYNLSGGSNAYSVYCNGSAGNAAHAWNGGNYADKLKHTIKYNGLNIAPTLDGVPMTQQTPATLVANTPTVTTWLFGRNNTSTGTLSQAGVRIYNVNIQGKGHFIPARRDSDGVVGMYDLADANPATAFHTNAGTGEFVAGPAVPIKIATTRYNEEQFEPVQNRLSDAMDAVDDVVTRTMSQAQAIDQIANEKQTRPDEGCTAKYCLLVEDEDGTPHWYPIAGANGVAHNLPNGYTELQYIESTGTQYIDTGIIPTNRTSISAKATVLNLNSGPSFFGSLSGNPLVGLLLGTNSTGNGALFVNKTTDALNIQITANSIYEINLSGTTLSIQKSGEQAQTFTTTPIVETAGNICIMGRNEDGVVRRLGAFKYYYMKIYENGILVRDLIPAKNASSVVGMYDMVSGQFFTNAGTGTFTAGPDM